MSIKGEPVENTCPLIDSVISDLDNVKSSIENIIGRRGELEEIRSANEALRSWGNEMRAEAEDWRDSSDAFEAELQTALSRIVELENELNK